MIWTLEGVYYCNLLVGGLEHVLFSIIYGITLPIDFHIFQDGCFTTNQFTSAGPSTGGSSN